VGAQANGAFTTKLFEMERGPIVLHAEMQVAPHGLGMFDQSYIMAELVDSEGAPIPGYERDLCVLTEMRKGSCRLTWRQEDGTALAGKTLGLRLMFRDARIHGVSIAGAGPA
jgi:hypothetical protein